MCLLPFLPAGETIAQTTTLVSNTGETASGLLNIVAGAKFETGSNSTGYTISSVGIWISGAAPTVTIRANDTNPTGTVIATLTAPATVTINAVNTFTAPAGTVLAANTTYWLRVDASSSATASTTTSDNESGATGWSIANTSRFQSNIWNTGNYTIRFAINGTPITPPNAPTGVTATAGNGQVSLSWSDPGNSNISKYQYRQGTGSPLVWGSWMDIINSDATTTTHTITGLSNGTEYSFQVRAVAGGSVNGTASATVTATPLAPPVVSIARQGSSAVIEGGSVMFRVTASQTVTANLTVNLTIAEAAGSNFIASNNKGMKTVDIPASSRSMTYTVATVNDADDEPNGSVTVTVRDGTGYTVGSPSEASVMVNDNDVPPPAKPTGFTATAGDEEVTLSWTDPKNSDITKYQYRQKAGSNSYGPWTDISNSAAAVTHTITGLTNGTAYTFQVRAVAGTLNGAPSNEDTATPRANSAPTVANPIPNQTATAGTAFRYQFSENTFNDADGDPLNYMATRGDGTALPTWLSFDATARTFSGTPQASDIGTLNIRVTASDDNGGTVFDAFDITVEALPMVTIAAGTSPVTEGTAASFTVTATPAPASNLDVNLSVAEAAGSDFVASGNEGMKTVTIPAASGSMTYTVATVNDDTDEPNGSVTVTVENDTGYTVGTPSEATVTVNDDDEEETLLGAEDTEETVIFPNPSGDYLEVWSSTRGTFKILSLSGKPLLEGSTNTRIDIAYLQSGLYLVQLPDGRLLKFVRE